MFSVAIGAADGALYAGTEPSRLFVARDGGRVHRARGAPGHPVAPALELPAAAVDAPRALDRPRPAPRGAAARRHRARRRDAHRRRRRDVLRPPARGQARRPPARLAPDSRRAAPTRPRATAPPGPATAARPGRRPTPGATAATAGRSPSTRDDPDCWYVSAASGPGAAHAGGERARGRLYRWDGGRWRRLALPDETMPYAPRGHERRPARRDVATGASCAAATAASASRTPACGSHRSRAMAAPR